MSDRRPMLWIVMVLYHKIRFCLLVINAVKPRSMGLLGLLNLKTAQPRGSYRPHSPARLLSGPPPVSKTFLRVYP